MKYKDYYGILGVDRKADEETIKKTYRKLARKYHPDLNQNDPEAGARSQTLNAAYEALSDPDRRRAYDRELARVSRLAAPKGRAKIEHNIKEEVRLRIEDFLRGTTLNLTVNDPANASGAETYHVTIPAQTAPGARFRIPRHDSPGHVELHLKALPGFRFKVRGADLRTDLRISTQRAAQGGAEMIERPTGGMIRLTIPKRVKRGEIIRIAGEGMPRPRGGRGDLLVRVTYRPEVRVTRSR